MTGGLVVLLFVVYELFVTDALTDRRQDQLKEDLRQEWTAAAEAPTAPRLSILGDAFAVLHIPRLGADYEQVVLEGTAEEQLAQQAPLAARLRPMRLDDIVGQEELVGPGRPLRVLVESDRLSSAIFWGPPGTGKTTLAQVIARHTAKVYEQLSAVSASVKDVREIVAKAEQRLGD